MTETARAPGPDPSPDPPTGSDPSLLRFRAVLEAGLAALEARREEVNELNVFPVADGDTGDNMVLTLRAVLQELDRLATAPPEGTIERVGRDEIVASVARAALLGARGNSGVILSQLIRGAAEELASRPGELVDPVLISAALARAADQAYGSVREPVEGTILTVVREMGVQVASEVARMRDARLAPDASAEEQNGAIVRVIETALRAGESSVERGPDLLAGATRRGRRRRRRLRADRVRRGHRRCAARSCPGAARAPGDRAGHPSPALFDDLPLLRELRGHGHRSGAAAVRTRRSSGSATRC